jgi:hypothetical protein
MGNKPPLYRIQFRNDEHIYELYARSIAQDFSYGFIEIADMVFGEKSELLVDPNEEKLKTEFAGVKRTYIPIASVIRIDEVDQAGTSKIHPGHGETGKISPFPIATPGKPEKP